MRTSYKAFFRKLFTDAVIRSQIRTTGVVLTFVNVLFDFFPDTETWNSGLIVLFYTNTKYNTEYRYLAVLRHMHSTINNHMGGLFVL